MNNILVKLPFFAEARTFYRKTFKPDALRKAQSMRDFYGQFIPAGSTVFDVGANLGEYAEVFAASGGRVIAIEPNPSFRDRLIALSQGANITPAFVAVGSSPGTAELNVCSNAAYSTMAQADAGWMKDSPDYDGVEWTHKVEVEVATLAQLAERYGVPSYVKIDVEGFELEVLKGMAAVPNFLSFEFGARRMADALKCLDLLAARGFQSFRPITGRDYAFATPRWMKADEALAWLNDFTIEKGEYGDMFASFQARD